MGVDADAVLSFTIALQRFESIAGKCREVGKARGCVESIQTGLGLPGETGESLGLLPLSKESSTFVAVADDHAKLTLIMHYVNRKSTTVNSRGPSMKIPPLGHDRPGGADSVGGGGAVLEEADVARMALAGPALSPLAMVLAGAAHLVGPGARVDHLSG